MKKEMMLIIGMVLILVMVPPACADAIIIDPTCTNLSEIQDEWIDGVKDNLHIAYQCTSHGRGYLVNPTGYSMNCIDNGE